jgi:PAS domain S-box-containing protein
LVSREQRVDEELQRERDFSQALIASMQDGLVAVSPSGTIMEVNDRLCTMLGYRREELIGCSPPFPYWPEEELHTLRSTFERAIVDRSGEFEVVLRRRSGERFPVIISVAALAGASAGHVSTIKDVTRRMRDRQELARREAENRALAGEQAAFRRVATAVASGADPAGVFGLVAKETAELVGVELAAVTRFERADRGRIVGEWVTDPSMAPRGDHFVSLHGDTAAARVAQTRRVARVDEDVPGQALRVRDHRYKSRLAAPVWVGARLWGCVSCATTRPESLAENDAERLGQFADLVAMAVANADPRGRGALRGLVETLLTDAPVGLAFVDRGLRVMRVNQRFAATFGLRPEHFIGKHPEEVLGRRGAELADRYLRPVLKAGEPVLDIALTSGEEPDDEGHHWIASFYPVRGDEDELALGVGVVMVDVTERQEAEAALRREHDFSSALLAALQDGMLVVSPDNRVLEVSPRMCEMTGFSREELIGAREPFPWWPPETADVIGAAIDMVRGAGGGEIDLVFQRKNGDRFPAILSISTLHDGDGHLAGFLTTVKDATERQEAEAARARERAVAEGLRRSIEAREAERERLARELHDETAQVLAAMVLHLEMLEDHVPGEQGRAWLGELRAAANSALDGVRDMAHDLRPPLLRELGLAAAIERLRERMGDQGLEVEVALEALPDDLLDEVEIAIFRVVQEALANVARHAQARHASVLTEREGDRLRLVIEDDGRGFEPHLPTDRLGLRGMRERVDLVGGNLQIESRAGQGTTIIVDLVVPTAARERPGDLDTIDG